MCRLFQLAAPQNTLRRRLSKGVFPYLREKPLSAAVELTGVELFLGRSSQLSFCGVD